MPVRMLGFIGGWIVRSHVDWRAERNILYKGVQTSPSTRVLKTEWKTKRESPNRTISASGGLEPLQFDCV